MPSAQPQDDDRPDEIELLLHRERPEVAHCTSGTESPTPHLDVLQVRPVPDRIAAELPSHRLEIVWPGQYYEEQDKRCVIQRKNAEDASHVELTEVVFAAFGVVQNPRYEKSGKHEEQIHTHPASSGNPEVEPVDQSRGRVRYGRIRRKVEEQNQQNCNSAKSVESGNPRLDESQAR